MDERYCDLCGAHAPDGIVCSKCQVNIICRNCCSEGFMKCDMCGSEEEHHTDRDDNDKDLLVEYEFVDEYNSCDDYSEDEYW